MERKMKYIAPVVLDEIKIEMEGAILGASHVDEPIEKDIEVESMGQELESGTNWDFKWEN